MGHILSDPRGKSNSFDEMNWESQNLARLKNIFCLQIQQVYQIYHYFTRLDRQYRGYLELDDFIYQFSQYDQNFVEMPYLQHLFTLIKKSKPNIVFFEEFVTGMAVFCLMNNQSVLEFVFDCIDKDDDSKISKEDIKKFISFKNPKNSKEIFFTNFKKQIEKLKLKENQTVLDFDQFRSNSDRLHFLIWPAYKLQATFRNSILGQIAWFDLYSKAQKKEYEIKNNEKKQSRLKEKLQILKTLKRKEQGPFFKNQIKLRKLGETSTDLKTQSHITRVRRNSCPYLKPNFKVTKENQAIAQIKRPQVQEKQQKHKK